MAEQDEQIERLCFVCDNHIEQRKGEITSCKDCRSSFPTWGGCDCGTYIYFHCRDCKSNMYKCADCGLWKPHKTCFWSTDVDGCCELCMHGRMVKELQGIQQKYPQYEFQIIDTVLQFRYKCTCNQHLNWMKWGQLDECKNNAIIQCENCNPSNDRFVYTYRKVKPWISSSITCWVLEQANMTCVKCDGITTYNNILQNKVAEIESFTTCAKCNPSTADLKYKWNGYTWEVHTKKVYNDKCNRHVWQLAGGVSENYKCPCKRCSVNQYLG